MPQPLRLSIIGSTGSIGEQTLRVVDRYPGRLKVVALAAGSNAARLAEQAKKYGPDVIALADQSRVDALRTALGPRSDVQVLVGGEGIEETAAWPEADTTVIAAVGFAGVRPTIAAIRAGKKIALANKETLVAAGWVVMPLAQKHGVTIAPIDSEHSAIWQCLRSGRYDEVRRIILTASGGPFLHRPLSTFDSITPAEGLAHPTWKMGPRITIDSATMMNKGFEIIEAAWLFGIKPSRVDVVIHPQSIIHSLVEFQDGSVVAQLGIPDMTLPITYALFAPDRAPATADVPRYDPASGPTLEFHSPEPDRYPALQIARDAFAMGPTSGAVLNAADEVGVAAFLEGRLTFPGIARLVQAVLAEHTVVPDPDIEDIVAVDRWARGRAAELAGRAVSHPSTVV